MTEKSNEPLIIIFRNPSSDADSSWMPFRILVVWTLHFLKHKKKSKETNYSQIAELYDRFSYMIVVQEGLNVKFSVKSKILISYKKIK